MSQRPVHVVHIIPRFGFGGAERFVVELARHVPKTSVRQSVISLWNTSDLAKELPRGVSFHTLDFEKVARWKRVDRLTKFLSSIEADVVHTHLFGGDLWGRLAAHRLHLPVVTTEHNINVEESWVREFTKRKMRNFSQIYTSPSQAIAKFMHRAYGIAFSDIRVIQHGIDIARFEKIPAATFQAPLTLGIIGRLVPQKGHKIALEALRKLNTDSVRLVIVGEGDLKNSLQAFAQKIGVASQVEWRKPTADVAPVYQECDIILVPSLWEGLGLVVLEALASERLVIASNIGGIPEILSHTKTGILVSPGNSDELAQALSVQMRQPKASLRLAHQGRVWAQKHAQVTTLAEEYKQIYVELGTKKLL